MSPPRTGVIIGAGLAGAKAAKTLCEEGFDGRVVLLGAERERPYERPPLSKEYLRGEAGREQVFVHAEDFYDRHAIEVRLGETDLAIDTGGRAVVLGARERIGYDRLLLATGSRPRRLSLPGAELDGVGELRALADSDALRVRLQGGGRVAIVGGGWIGCQVAASARSLRPGSCDGEHGRLDRSSWVVFLLKRAAGAARRREHGLCDRSRLCLTPGPATVLTTAGET